MYNFLLSEVWWIETIIAACISAVVTLLIAFIAYNYKLNSAIKIISELPEERSSLNKEHNNLSKEHLEIIQNQSLIETKYDSIEKTNDKILNVVDKLNERSIAEEVKLQYLDKNQLDIKTVLDSVSSLNREMVNLQSENTLLKTENSLLKQENKQLSDIIDKHNDLSSEYEI